MTTIATDGEVIAGDGQREHRETILTSEASKVRPLKGGRFLGTAGDVAFGLAFEEWLNGDAEQPTPTNDGFSALVLNPDGVIHLYGPDGVAIEVPPPVAIGSGMDVAIGAMDAGADPVEAIIIASRRDPHTGGQVTSYAV